MLTNDKICAILYDNIPPYILLQGVREERSDHPLSRLDIKTPSKAQTVVDNLYRDVERRIAASPPGLCPVDMSLTFLQLCHAQTCGKCVPCRIGLGQLTKLIEMVLDGQADMSTLAIIEKTASSIVNTADCAIGRDAARLVVDGLEGFRDDYIEHIEHHRCLASLALPVPCVALCPAGVDVPGYMALVGEGRCADAVRLIRKDNPMPTACAYICEHPCEARCRRDMSCAYYLALMGHKVVIFEERHQLGGMLRYGIPSYRFPREKLDAEIHSILSLGIEAHTDVTVGKEITFEQLQQEYDCLYIAIGAHQGKGAGIPGEHSKNVMSAVEMLRGIGDGDMPDFTGKHVVVIGGGNVAMDVTRSSIRLGAEKVSCVYRRRIEDMTALPDEVTGAMAEGAEMLTLMAPVRIEANENDEAVALWVQPQIPGESDKTGRPRPEKADLPEVRVEADVIVVAIGQGIEIAGFEQSGVPIKRGTFVAASSSQVGNMNNVFAGGDCVTGPASAIRAIAAGKVAAANIDEHLGFHHDITVEVDIPAPRLNNSPPHGRINTTEREAAQRKNDFEDIECGLTWEGACTEASRCLRCDHYGYGIFRGGRNSKW